MNTLCGFSKSFEGVTGMGRRMLVTYVGDNDPFGRPDPKTGEPTTGPILSILDHLQTRGSLPDRVILLVTETHEHEFPLENGGKASFKQEGMEEQARQVKTAIGERYSSSMEVEEIRLRVNPADLDEVIDATLQGLRNEIMPDDEVHINVSSGTQAMSAAIVFLADSGFIRHYQVWQSLDPTKLPEGAIRVKPVNLAYLSERQRLERAIGLLLAMSFSYAELAFEEIAQRSLIPERRPKAAVAAKLMRVYKLWDSANFDQAFDDLQNVKNELQKLSGWSSIPYLEDQEKRLKKVKEDCKDRKETQDTLEDLYACILRRRAARDFISIPSQGRRLYEGILDFLIHEVGGLDLRSPLAYRDISSLGLDKRTENRILSGYVELRDREEVAQALAEKGILDREQIRRLKELYDEFKDARNGSREEHGFSGVDEKQADCVIESVTSIMRLVFPKTVDELQNHPFGVKALQAIAEGLKGWL